MANMHLVTGFAGREHVTSIDQGLLNSYIFGNLEVVMERGNQFEASIISNNIIRVKDGDLLMQGKFARLNDDSYVDLTIDNGTQGYFRNDLIVARYQKDAITAVETVDLVVIKGENAASDPADPAHVKGDIKSGRDFQNDVPLWRVSLNGLNVTGLTCLYSTFSTTLSKLPGHADRHSASGDDPVTPASIGAVPVATSFSMTGDRVKRIQTGGATGSNGNITTGGIVFGQTYQDLDNPESGIGTMRGTMNYGIFCGCDYTNDVDETALGARGFVVKAVDTVYKTPSALMIHGYDGGIKYYQAKERRVYEQNELLEMDEFNVLHTGNMVSLGCSRTQTGSYTGTGTYGASNPNSLIFDFVPKMVLIYTNDSKYYSYSSSAGGAVGYDNPYISVMWCEGLNTFLWGSGLSGATVSLDGKTLSWYVSSSDDGRNQMNYKNSYGQATYYWVAIG